MPLGGVVVNPTSLTLTSANPNQTFTVSQAGYPGQFSARSQNTMVATVAPTAAEHVLGVGRHDFYVDHDLGERCV